MSTFRMTLGELITSVKAWESDPELTSETPIIYERIEDKYFESYGWDSCVIRCPNIYPPDEPSQGIQAFTAYKRKDMDGNMCIFITAHY